MQGKWPEESISDWELYIITPCLGAFAVNRWLSTLADCRFTCHYRCRALIQLDCRWDRGSVADHTLVVEHTIETDTNVVRTFCILLNVTLYLPCSLVVHKQHQFTTVVTIRNETIPEETSSCLYFTCYITCCLVYKEQNKMFNGLNEETFCMLMKTLL